MKTLSILIYCLISIFFLNAQEIPFNQVKKLGVSIGWGDAHLSDPLLSPLHFRGKVITYGARYSSEGSSTKKDIQAVFSIGEIQPDVEQSAVSRYAASVSYNYLFRLNSNQNNRYQTWVGPGFRSDLKLFDFRGLDGGTWKFTHGLDAHVENEFNISPNSKFSSYLNSPVFASVVRPPYAGYNEQTSEDESNPISLLTRNGKWAGFWDNFVIRFGVFYNHQVSDQFDVRVGWDFEYQKYQKPKTIKSFSQRLNVGLDWKL